MLNYLFLRVLNRPTVLTEFKYRIINVIADVVSVSHFIFRLSIRKENGKPLQF